MSGSLNSWFGHGLCRIYCVTANGKQLTNYNIIIRKLPVQSETIINPDPHPLDKGRDKPMSLILVPQLDTDTVLIMSSVIFTIFGCVLIMM